MSSATLNEYLDALLEDLDPRSDDYAAITEALRAQASLIVAEWSGIKRILLKDDEVSVSFATKFVQAGKRIKGQVKIAYAEKFSDEAEFITPDFNQGNLFGSDASIRVNGVQVASAKEAADLIVQDAARHFGKGES
jgi:hypothetical protein